MTLDPDDFKVFTAIARNTDRIATALEALIQQRDEAREQAAAAERHALDAEFERLAAQFRRTSVRYSMADRHAMRRPEWEIPTEADREHLGRWQAEAEEAETALADFVRLHPDYRQREVDIIRSVITEELA